MYRKGELIGSPFFMFAIVVSRCEPRLLSLVLLMSIVLKYQRGLGKEGIFPPPGIPCIFPIPGMPGIFGITILR